MYYVYLLKSKNYNETYIGSTNDLKRRLLEHNNSMEISTKRYKPWQLTYYEAYKAEEDAREREMKLKHHGNAIRELKKRTIRSLKNGAGFTLIETVVAIFLLTTGVVGSFSLMQRVTAFASISSSQLAASYLAQEGIEIIRNIRDTNYLEGSAWDAGIGAATDFRLDYRSQNFPDAACGNYLKYAGNFYACSTDTSSKFQRQVTVTKPAVDKMSVSVTVKWAERGREHQVVAQTELYDWR